MAWSPLPIVVARRLYLPAVLALVHPCGTENGTRARKWCEQGLPSFLTDNDTGVALTSIKALKESWERITKGHLEFGRGFLPVHEDLDLKITGWLRTDWNHVRAIAVVGDSCRWCAVGSRRYCTSGGDDIIGRWNPLPVVICRFDNDGQCSAFFGYLGWLSFEQCVLRGGVARVHFPNGFFCLER